MVTVAIDGPTRITAGAAGVWTLRFAIGADGLAAGEALALVRRWPSDWDLPQCDRPRDAGYTAIETHPPAPFLWRTRRSLAWHPFDHVFEVIFPEGLPAGASVTVTLGDRRGGAPGLRAQTFIEEGSPLSIRRHLGDTDWREIARPLVEVVGGAAVHADLIAPSDVAVDEAFEVVFRTSDAWGNPSADRPDAELRGAPAEALPGRAMPTWSVRANSPGLLRLAAEGGGLGAVSNPIMVHASPPARRIRWGDIHAQSVIGCGARTIDAYFRHARDFARLDFASHQANCFLVSGPEWRETEAITAGHHAPGRFVTLLGLEWSAETSLGGDRNLYLPGDNAPITRCSHACVDDKSDLATDLPDAAALHAHYRDQPVLIGFHVGGRTTDLARHDPMLERLIEVHSTHATSEWFLFEALRRGYRLGVTAGSDGVDGRPGASHPGHQAVRNCRGGLVAVPLTALDRQTLWDGLWARNCYATTGARIHLTFTADGHPMGSEVRLCHPPRLEIAVAGTAPLEAIDIFRGTDVIHAVPLARQVPLSDRLRIGWRGASAPGNFARARMRWDGFATLSAGRFLDVAGWADDTADEGVTRWNAECVEWRSTTGGDWDGVIVEIDAPDDALLHVHTAQLSMALPLSRLGQGPVTLAETTPHRELDLRRLPIDQGPLDWSGGFTDAAPVAGWNAYWVRIRQADGAFAWSTPVFVELEGGASGR
jgi:hypothetical protein